MTTLSSEDREPVPKRSLGAPLRFGSISPPEQGDAIAGLTLAIAGVGPAGAPDLSGAMWPEEIGGEDAWAIAVDAESGWCVLLSQDCDIVRSPDEEPTVLVAPLVIVSEQKWNDLNNNAYSARRFAYPREKLGVSDEVWLAVDLAWTTSVIKGALSAEGVVAVRPLTGPNKKDFTEWLASRLGRAAFPDEVVEFVLDPCYEVRTRLLKRFAKALADGSTAPLEARAVGASTRWYARVDGRLVHVIGELTGPSLQRAGFADGGELDVASLTKAEAKLQSEVIKRMLRVSAGSGFEIKVQLVDLAHMRASQFREFALLVR